MYLGAKRRYINTLPFLSFPFPHGKGHSTPPTFRPMSIVAKRSPVSATAELLLRYAYRQTDMQTRWSQYFAPLIPGAK